MIRYTRKIRRIVLPALACLLVCHALPARSQESGPVKVSPKRLRQQARKAGIVVE
jgi:hypothetical protein